MNLSDLCQTKYEQWIENDTWFKGETYDYEHFYDFVNEYIKCSENKIMGADLRKDIMARQTVGDLEYFEKKAQHFGELFDGIVEFIKHTNR